MAKVGVYLCSCGGTISDAVDFDKVIKACQEIEDVAVVRTDELYCGGDGQSIIEKDLSEGIIDRVMTLACSPKMHSKTFEGVFKRSGQNPYLLNMVNIREQCTWMTPDKDKATEKVIRLARAGIERVKLQEPLEEKEIEINSDVMVIGAGIAGVEAALQLSKAGRKVYLVEKEAAFGGMIVKLEHTYPSGECAPCILAPRTKSLSDDENIIKMTSTAVKQVVGFGGNFTVTVEQKPRYVDEDACISCMMCIEDCPASAPDPFNGGKTERKAVDFPFPGCSPKAPNIDEKICLRFKGEECNICNESCDFDAIDYDQKAELIEINVGSIIIAIGAEVYDISKVYPGLIDTETNIYSGLDFERIMSTTGWTRGTIQLVDGSEPKSVAIIHCVGSRNEKHLPYCSGVCCKYALKHSHGIVEKVDSCKVVHIFSDLCVEGPKFQKQVDHLKAKGVDFKRWQMGENSIADLAKNGDKIVVSGISEQGQKESFEVDMAVLATGFTKNKDLDELCEQLSLTLEDDFVAVAHEKIGAIATTADGVYIVGTANSPKDITASVIDAKAATGDIMSTYIPGQKMKLDPTVACVDSDICGGCQTCVALCPYHAPIFDAEKKVVEVSEVLCKGCGTCVAACPAGAMQAKHFTREQIISEIKGVLK